MGQPESPAPAARRLASVDAYRGLVMFLMMAEVLRLSTVAKALPGNAVWQFLAGQQTHVEWVGCSLHDLIQPSFSFLVGVSLPFSIASRVGRGQSKLVMSLHAFWRAFVLIWLGIILRSFYHDVPDYGFMDTLCQIGLGYGFLFLLGFRRVRDQWIAFALILAGYWLFFAFGPASAPLHVKPGWAEQFGLSGFEAHWNKNANAASPFDVWFLNQFPREKHFDYNPGGYQVLNFIPTLSTMILGLIAGGVLKSDRSAGKKIAWLAIAGGLGLGAGYGLGMLGACPVVKRIWTPSWVLFSGGWCCLLLAAFYTVIDVAGWKGWAFPLLVIGMNSIAAYCLADSFVKPELEKMVERHLGASTLLVFGPEYRLFFRGAITLLLLWLILLWMYRRKVFLRV
jgi:heparan-alpha-glucosaminide N-acetyltransferase